MRCCCAAVARLFHHNTSCAAVAPAEPAASATPRLATLCGNHTGCSTGEEREQYRRDRRRNTAALAGRQHSCCPPLEQATNRSIEKSRSAGRHGLNARPTGGVRAAPRSIVGVRGAVCRQRARCRKRTRRQRARVHVVEGVGGSEDDGCDDHPPSMAMAAAAAAAPIENINATYKNQEVKELPVGSRNHSSSSSLRAG